MIDFVGPLIGFVSAWVLFELTSLRRRVTHRRGLKIALVSELEHAEYHLSFIVLSCSYGSEDPVRGVAEARWIISKGHEREPLLPHFPHQLKDFSGSLSDKDWERMLKKIEKKRTRLEEVNFPTVDSILSTPGSGLTRDSIEILSRVKWGAHSLNSVARAANEIYQILMQADVSPKVESIVQAYVTASDEYCSLAHPLLDYVRLALHTLDMPSNVPVIKLLRGKGWVLRE